MGKLVHNSVIDAALNIVKNNSIDLIVCSQQPVTYEDANSDAFMLATISITPADFSGPEDGDISGRKISMTTKVGFISNPGTSNHIALCSNDDLLYVDTCSQKVFEVGNMVTVSGWKIEIGDPL